jgi:hypothetical protein
MLKDGEEAIAATQILHYEIYIGLLEAIEGGEQYSDHLATAALEVDQEHQEVHDLIEDVLIGDASGFIGQAAVAHPDEDLQQIVVQTDLEDVFDRTDGLEPDAGVVDVLGQLPEFAKQLLDYSSFSAYPQLLYADCMQARQISETSQSDLSNQSA